LNFLGSGRRAGIIRWSKRFVGYGGYIGSLDIRYGERKIG
jgi:hypothetical protein